MTTRAQHILNPIFLSSLIILLLNDHVLKDQYPNWLTGKLSDFFGIIVFVQFLSFFVAEQYRKFLYIFSALFFIFWKSEWSSGFINFWNFAFPYLSIQRIVDYTDLICLLVLIPLYKYKPKQFQLNFPKEIITYPIFALTLVAILATSRVQYFHANEIYVDDIVKLNMTRNEFLNQLTTDQVAYSKDSIFIFAKDTFDRYVLNNIVIDKDTIHSATIGIYDKKSSVEVYIERLILSKDWGANLFHNYKTFKKWKKKFKAETKNYFERLDE